MRRCFFSGLTGPSKLAGSGCCRQLGLRDIRDQSLGRVKRLSMRLPTRTFQSKEVE